MVVTADGRGVQQRRATVSDEDSARYPSVLPESYCGTMSGLEPNVDQPSCLLREVSYDVLQYILSWLRPHEYLSLRSVRRSLTRFITDTAIPSLIEDRLVLDAVARRFNSGSDAPGVALRSRGRVARGRGAVSRGGRGRARGRGRGRGATEPAAALAQTEAIILYGAPHNAARCVFDAAERFPWVMEPLLRLLLHRTYDPLATVVGTVDPDSVAFSPSRWIAGALLESGASVVMLHRWHPTAQIVRSWWHRCVDAEGMASRDGIICWKPLLQPLPADFDDLQRFDVKDAALAVAASHFDVYFEENLAVEAVRDAVVSELTRRFPPMTFDELAAKGHCNLASSTENIVLAVGRCGTLAAANNLKGNVIVCDMHLIIDAGMHDSAAQTWNTFQHSLAGHHVKVDISSVHGDFGPQSMKTTPYALGSCPMKQCRLPASIEVISDWFLCCTPITEVDLRDHGNVKSIGNFVFIRSTVRRVWLPPGLTRIGHAFCQNSAVELIDLSRCRLLRSKIGHNFAQGCTNLAELRFPSNLVVLPKRFLSFCNKTPALGSLSHVRRVRSGAFAHCDDIPVLPAPLLQFIGNMFGLHCRVLQVLDLTYLNQVRHIGSRFMEGSSELVTIIFPASLLSVGSHCAAKCTEIQTLDFRAATSLKEVGPNLAWQWRKPRRSIYARMPIGFPFAYNMETYALDISVAREPTPPPVTAALV